LLTLPNNQRPARERDIENHEALQVWGRSRAHAAPADLKSGGLGSRLFPSGFGGRGEP